jgi:acyl carrier protein
MSTFSQVKDYILKFIAVADIDGNLGDDDSLVEKGIINSTGVLELVAFLERTFGIACADEEITVENLDSLARIAAYVESKQKNREPTLVSI